MTGLDNPHFPSNATDGAFFAFERIHHNAAPEECRVIWSDSHRYYRQFTPSLQRVSVCLSYTQPTRAWHYWLEQQEWDGAGVRVGHVPASYRDIKYVLADALLNDRDGGFRCSVDVMYSCRRWHVLGSTSYARNTLTQNGTGFLLLLLLLLQHIIPPTPRHVRMKPTAVEQLYSTLPATATASQWYFSRGDDNGGLHFTNHWLCLSMEAFYGSVNILLAAMAHTTAVVGICHFKPSSIYLLMQFPIGSAQGRINQREVSFHCVTYISKNRRYSTVAQIQANLIAWAWKHHSVLNTVLHQFIQFHEFTEKPALVHDFS